MKTEKRCTGDCCQKFTLPFSPEELKTRYLYFVNSGAKMPQKSVDNKELNGDYIKTVDIHLIYPMVTYLGKFKKTPQGKKLKEFLHWYTCKHFNKKTNNCTIYDIRPQMCSDYPYGGKCYYKGCTDVHAASKSEREEYLRPDKNVNKKMRRK